MRGQQQAYLHATAGGMNQGALFLVSWGEIGGRDFDARPGAANGRQQRGVVARRQGIAGPAAKDTDHLIALRRVFLSGRGEHRGLAALLQPMLIKQLLELVHGRTYDLQVGHRARVPSGPDFGSLPELVLLK